VLLNIFVVTSKKKSGFFAEYKKKRTALFEVEKLCNIINGFALICDQFNESFMNKIIS